MSGLSFERPKFQRVESNDMKAKLHNTFLLHHIIRMLLIGSCLFASFHTVKAKSLGDTTQANLFSKRAIPLFNTAPDSAFFYYEASTKALGDGPWTRTYFEVLIALTNYYERHSDPDGMLPYMHHILDHYTQHQSGGLQLMAYRHLAMSHAYKGELEPALDQFEIEKKFLDSCVQVDPLRYCDHHIHHYSNLGIAYAIASQTTNALEQFVIGDSLAEACGSPGLKASMKYCLGSIMTDLNQPQKSISYFKVLEAWHDRGEIDYDMTASYDNMVIAYMQLKHYDSAQIYLKKSLAIARQNGDSVSIAFNYLYQAEILWETGKGKLAIDYFTKSENLFKSSGAELMYRTTQLKRITCSLDNKIYNNETASELDAMESYFASSQRKIDIAKVIKQRARYLALIGQYALAYSQFTRFDSLQEINQDEAQKEKLAELQTQHETALHKREAQKQAAIAQLKQEEAESKSLTIGVLTFISVVLLLVLLAVFILFKNLKKSRRIVALQKAGIEKKENEKSVLLKELHHRVKNNLQIVSSLLNLQRQNAKDEAAKGAFKEGQNRVEAMALIHRYLYATDELTKLELDKYLRQLVQSIAFSYGYNKSDVSLVFEISETPVDVDLAIPLGLIANELVSNVFKHAFRGSDHPEIQVRLTYTDQLILEIADNGPGISEFNNSKDRQSFGMDLVHTLCSQLKAELNYRYENGAVIQLIIQLANSNKHYEDTAA